MAIKFINFSHNPIFYHDFQLCIGHDRHEFGY